MTAYSPRHAFGVARDLPELRPEPVPSFFRRLIAALRRKPAAPEVLTSASGAGRTGLLAAPDDGGGDDPSLWDDEAEPVLGDRTLADVRRQCDTGQLAKIHPAPHLPPERPTLLARPDGVIMIDERHAIDVQPVRPAPVYGEAPQLDVERDMAIAAGMRARAMYEPPTVELLQDLLDGLRAMPAPTTAGPELAERYLA